MTASDEIERLRDALTRLRIALLDELEEFRSRAENPHYECDPVVEVVRLAGRTIEQEFVPIIDAVLGDRGPVVEYCPVSAERYTTGMEMKPDPDGTQHHGWRRSPKDGRIEFASERIIEGIKLTVAAMTSVDDERTLMIRWLVSANASDPTEARSGMMTAAGTAVGASMPEVVAKFEEGSSADANACVTAMRAAMAVLGVEKRPSDVELSEREINTLRAAASGPIMEADIGPAEMEVRSLADKGLLQWWAQGCVPTDLGLEILAKMGVEAPIPMDDCECGHPMDEHDDDAWCTVADCDCGMRPLGVELPELRTDRTNFGTRTDPVYAEVSTSGAWSSDAEAGSFIEYSEGKFRRTWRHNGRMWILVEVAKVGDVLEVLPLWQCAACGVRSHELVTSHWKGPDDASSFCKSCGSDRIRQVCTDCWVGSIDPDRHECDQGLACPSNECPF